jgi:hypothetical protein
MVKDCRWVSTNVSQVRRKATISSRLTPPQGIPVCGIVVDPHAGSRLAMIATARRLVPPGRWRIPALVMRFGVVGELEDMAHETAPAFGLAVRPPPVFMISPSAAKSPRLGIFHLGCRQIRVPADRPGSPCLYQQGLQPRSVVN